MSVVRSLCIVGAAGRMGLALVREAAGEARVRIAAAVERPDSGAIGVDAGVLAGVDPIGVAIAAPEDVAFDSALCVVDFSAPANAVEVAERAAEAGAALIVGATGFSRAEEARIARAAERTLILKAGNMSLGVNLLARLVRQAASALGPAAYDVEIVEAHHRRKVDAPSGTALLLAEAVDAGRGGTAARRDGSRAGARVAGDIGFAVMRGGGVVGDHTVAFIGERETIELGHRALDRSLFARGAIEAAIYVAEAWDRDRRPGLVGMDPVIDSLIAS